MTKYRTPIVNRLSEIEETESERLKRELEEVGADINKKKQLVKGHEEIQFEIRTEADFRNFVKTKGNSLAKAILNGYDTIVGTQGSRFAKMVEDNPDASDIIHGKDHTISQIFAGEESIKQFFYENKAGFKERLIPKGYPSVYLTCDGEDPIRQLMYRGRAFGIGDVSLSFIMGAAGNPCYYDEDSGRRFLTNNFYMEILPNYTEIYLPDYFIDDKGKFRSNDSQKFRGIDLTSSVQHSFLETETIELDYKSRVVEFLKGIVDSAERTESGK